MLSESRLLEGKVCFVTGAARGIGRAVLEHFAREGAVVCANARKQGCLEDLVQEYACRYDAQIVPIYFDITDTSLLKQAIAQIKKEQGKLDVLVNNAGITSNELIGMIREETVYRLFQTNVFAGIQALQLAARVMKRQDSGSIINISSIIGVEGARGELAYSGTKGAVISITKSAAKELAPHHIRVNAVAPGMTETDMFLHAAGSGDIIEEHISHVGFGRLAKPSDIAEACVFLASDRSAFITGQILGVNGSTII